MKKPLTCSTTVILATSLLPTCLSFSRPPNHRLLRYHDSMALPLRGPSSSSSSSSSKRSRSFFRSSSISVPPSTTLSRHANYDDHDDDHSNSNNDNNHDDDDALRRTHRPLTASQSERRREDLRRQTRGSSGFATPGVSSAVPGARDYDIDVNKTEREYLESLGIFDPEGYFRREEDEEEMDEELALLLKRARRSDSVELRAQIEKHVAIQSEKGLRRLRMLDLPRASRAFATVYALRPDAYLWHDGLVKYYLGDYHGAAESLARNAVRYEERFGGEEAASEERIWRDAAELKIVHCWNGGRWVKSGSGVPVALRVGDVLREKREKEKKEEEKWEGEEEEEVESESESESVMSLEEEDEMERESIAKERRKVIRLARELFSASIRQDSAKVALARAKLQAIANATTTNNKNIKSSSSSFVTNLSDPKQYKLHSHFYLGLHYDAMGQPDESKRCMKMALKACADRISGNGNDITLLLPVLHMTVRDWYDDDEFDDEDIGGGDDAKELDAGENEATEEEEEDGLTLGKWEKDHSMEEDLPSKDGTSMGITTHVGMSTSDRILESIRESIRDMTVVELRKELKKRKLKVGGLKTVLQERLVNDLKRDAGLA
mmetsp:Transcript_2525/g.5437  ORF Transcript_2525/g.5437 Transcript_2525/m.5437 type:complete len:608 (-) Transcript_2525:140-1963(-)|eukprot:CAMPEP_0171399312 /NCGR_PEP_ID=MMETSP0880-20121228/6536_1 /TAXON_ID=67004 /ORGANISM="Thalassiosira weissflogii, Strain CCMP1336" /LENGTH=607 /DNA_ID=CAMNT_0011913465 /DNA_START=177 /DNA_END=2000 /DNA_ORIENTATION=-